MDDQAQHNEKVVRLLNHIVAATRLTALLALLILLVLFFR